MSQTLTFQEVPALRKTTEALSQYLQQRLTGYLETLKPLLAPDRFLGKYVGAKADVPGVDKAMAQLTQSYQEIAGKPLEIPREFEPEWLGPIGSRLELHRAEYIHNAVAGGVTKPIRITSPLRWFITFGSSVTPFQALQIASGHERAPADGLRAFVVNALVMQLVLSRNTGFTELFGDLRFELRTEQFPETGKLPFITIASCLPTFRPADDLIIAATEFSGVSAFIELIDAEACRGIQDPLKKQVEGLLG